MFMSPTHRRSLNDACERLSELGHEGNHQVEETNGLDEGETQNGVREELAAEGGVAGDTVDEGGEDETDTDTGTGQTDGGGAHAEVPGDLDHGLGDLGGVGAAGVEVGEGLAGGGVDGGGGLLALNGLEGAVVEAGDGALRRDGSELGAGSRPGDLGGGRSHEPGSETGRHLD
jgi:hypothetical protein